MKNKLKFISGQGYEHSKENGKFEVKSNGVTKFTKLSEAKKFYDSINEEKAIWDKTYCFAELIECHTNK